MKAKTKLQDHVMNVMSTSRIKFLTIMTAIAISSPVAAQNEGSTPALKSDFSISSCPAWKRNAWKGYDPFPEYGIDEEQKALHVRKSASPKGFGFVNNQERITAKAGDTVVVNVIAKGSGSMFVGLQNFSGGKFVGVAKSVSFQLEPEWKEFNLEIPVENLKSQKDRTTDQVMLTFGGSQDTELFLKCISAYCK